MDKTDIIDKYYCVLDDGFISLKDYMGSDHDIEQAARVSYGKGTRKTSDTTNLLRYLMRHRHSTPFEMAELKFHVRVPMDTWRQWIRHRTASVNEYSTRYSEAINSQQKTRSDEWRKQSSSNKQGSSDYLPKDGGYIAFDPDTETGDNWIIGGDDLTTSESNLHELSREVYLERLEAGVAREQARKDLPLSTYTEAYWKIDLKNLLHFMSLRCDEHAQLEIRSYAKIIASIVKTLFPITFQAWYDYDFAASNFSSNDKLCIAELLKQISWADLIRFQESIGMSKREQDEFKTKLEIRNIVFPDLDTAKLYSISKQ